MADLPSSDFANGIPSVAQPAGDQKPLAPEKHETAQKRVFKQGQALPNNVHRASVQDHQEPTEGGSAALMQEVQMLREKLFKLGDRVAQMGHEIDQDQTTDTTHESDFEEHRSQRRRRKAAKWAEKRETRAAELQQHERVTQGAPFMHWIKEDGKFRFEDSLEPKTNSIVLLRPFRLLTAYATDIRKWHANLIQAPEAPAPTGTAEESKAAGQETIHKGQPISGENVKPQDVSSEKEINPVSAIDPHGYSRSKETAAHLGCLIEFMDNRIAKRQAYLNSPSCSKVLFSDLWHLFKPGDFVISSDSKQVYQVFRVLLAPHCGIDPWAAYFQKPNDSDSDETDNFITICCVHINFDGYQLGPCYARLVPSIEGNHTTLPSVAVFPRLLKDITNGSNLTDDELLIMSYKVPGFVLRDRTWAWLDLDYLSDVVSSAEDATPSDHDEEDQGAFGQLVLPGGHKDMVLSLVSQHFRNKNRAHAKDEQTDIVGGKGLIILLHGAPGVGKTTTAEGVAERFKKPLFQITCGDLGSNVADVEAALQTNFALANKWDCALLLDEADVFLAERRRTDFHRNGLVAVFKLNLRLIKSRYASRNSKIKIDEDEILQTAGAHWRNEPEARWNGRQIRNACQTALALAEYEAQPEGAKFDLNVDNEDRKVHLTVSYLNKVTQAYLDFMKYLKAVHETDAERRARENGLRALESMAAAFANKDVNVNRGDGLAGWNVPQRSASPGNPHHWSNVSGYGQAPYPQDTRFCNTK
ncbi:hypothetical protein MCOR08_000592 [Pyricularia oryzae]|nr:hypothetical protein MCOR08_000592 [Pyricularia oryzae]